ncbi:MAG: chorismate synthase [Ignavibacteria bacterium GWA2_54_16]|nr:MAG: chorismate synthase [Ignavibacteria bacterium GWA2_54_16]
MIRYLTAGESHGQALVGILEGVPAGVSITAEYINHQLWRRQQGYGRGGRMRIESDQVEVLSGVRFGKTLGSPIALLIRNADWSNWKERMSVHGDGKKIEKITIPRPGHVDFAGSVKYGFDDIRNTIERGSARETAMRVACCTIVRKFLEDVGVFIGSHVLSIGPVGISNRRSIDRMIARYMKASCGAYKITEQADKSEVRMLDGSVSRAAISLIKRTKKAGDTLGGIAEIFVSGVPVGLGSHVHYDRKLDGQLAQALMSIHAVKGVEIGSGFHQAKQFGSDVHDEFKMRDGRITRRTNRAGGLEGGVTNGQAIVLHAAMKPISTLAHPLQSVDVKTLKGVKARYERSDVCAVPAFSVIAEAVVAPVLANAFLEKFGGDSLGEVLLHCKKRG